jgi:Cytochrome c3
MATPPGMTTRPGMATQPGMAMQSNMSHVGVVNGCIRCHNGVAATGKPPNHVITTAPCESCHKSTVTFAGAAMNHAGIVGNCASCHNGGGGALGKPAKHIVTNAPCESCHRSTVTFEGARVDHASITATCATCHNGATAEGKPPRHFITTLPCDTCHRTVAWIPANYRHISPAYVNHGPNVECASCHSANAQVVGWKFPAFRPGCAGCHVDKFRPTSHPKLERPVKVYYTVAELRDCTGACHIYSDYTQRTILTRQSGRHRSAGGGW